MRWSRTLAAALCCLCCVAFLCVLRAQPEAKRLGVYTPQSGHLVWVIDRDGAEYVALADVLAPLAPVDARLDGKKWKLRIGNREAQFNAGKTKAKIDKRDVELASPFQIDNGRGLVPVASLQTIVPDMLPGHAVSWRPQSRRLFIDKPELHYSAEIRNHAALVLNFSAPVNPTIATEPGHLRMVFTRQALAASAGAETQTFPDVTIPALRFVEQNGAAELVVSGNAALIASFSADRKTITIAPVTPPQAAQTAPAPGPAQAAPAASAARTTVTAPKYVIVIDAAHGADDRGAALSTTLVEKDVALAFARRLHRELEARGLASRLMRDADVNLTPEQRASSANAAGPALYLAVHATGVGTGVRVFTSSLARDASSTAVFLPWDTAQAHFVDASQRVATGIATELLKRDVPAVKLPASLRPLNSIAGPAVAIEVATPQNGVVDDLNAAQYQVSICTAIASGIAASHLRWGPRGGPQ